MKIKIPLFKQLTAVLIIILIGILAFIIEFSIISIIEKQANKEENIIVLEGNIKTIEVDESSEMLYITLDNYPNIFKASTNKKEIHDLKDKLNINDYIKIGISKLRLKQKKILIINIEMNDVLIVDLTDDNLKAVKQLDIVSIILSIIEVIVLVLFILYYKYKLIFYKEYDYIEYVSLQRSTNFIYENNFSYQENEKRKMKVIYLYLLFVIILAVSVVFLGVNFPEYPHIIIPIIVVLMCIGTYLLFKNTIIYKYKKEDVKKFVSKYKKYLNKEIDINKIQIFDFKKDGIPIYHYNKDKDDFEVEYDLIPYSKLNLYTCIVYKNNFHFASIFICSDYLIDDKPLIIELTPLIYTQIKYQNVYIKQLDYVLNNLENEIYINKPKSGKKFMEYK